MDFRRERRVSEIYHTPPPAPRRILTYGAPPFAPPAENMTEERHLRIKLIMLEQDLAQAQQDLERSIAQTHLAIAQRDIAMAAKDTAESKMQDLTQVVETTSRHTDQLSALEKANITTHAMLQQILDILQKSARSIGADSETPSLIDVDDRKPSTDSVFGDFVDLAGWNDIPPTIDISPSQRSSHGFELLDIDTLPEAPSEVIRRFSTELKHSDTTTVREETDLKCPELVRLTKFPLWCNNLTSLSVMKASKRASQLAF
jgi:hypothetical protein